MNGRFGAPQTETMLQTFEEELLTDVKMERHGRHSPRVKLESGIVEQDCRGDD